jgi:hypothetical protein
MSRFTLVLSRPPTRPRSPPPPNTPPPPPPPPPPSPRHRHLTRGPALARHPAPSSRATAADPLLPCPQGRHPNPPPPRTKWTRCVLHPVLIGHAASLSQGRHPDLAVDPALDLHVAPSFRAEVCARCASVLCHGHVTTVSRPCHDRVTTVSQQSELRSPAAAKQSLLTLLRRTFSRR